MEITYTTFTRPDGNCYRQIQISDCADWKLFERVASFLEAGLQGHWTEQLDGIDQRYWDLSVRVGQLTLHLEHSLGIMLYPTAGADANPESLVLLVNAFNILAAQEIA
jgi:hypothetical protein